MSDRPCVSDLLSEPQGLLTRSDLAALGLPRRGVDAVFRSCPVVVLPGFARPMVKVSDYLELVASSTYRGDRVRP